jgi:predicted phage terminase large subunit-like protein
LVDFSQSIIIPGAPMSDDPEEWLFKPIESAVAKHHIVMMQAIERCVRGDYGRLMIFAPPGSAKSSYVSVVAPIWAMGAFPGKRVLMTSYASTPIIRHSKRARQIAASDEYQGLWDNTVSLVDGSKAADEFELTNGSSLFACGLLGGITSVRADLGIIDDPVAGREEAESETFRLKTLAAYEDDFLTRLKPRASVILIQTRWHQDDLAGSILPEDYDGRSGPVLCRDGQVWEILNIQAKCERADDPIGREVGDLLWPEWFSAKHWAIYEKNPRTWASLYQQRPAPAEGIYFKRADFKRYDTLPNNLRFYECSDFAVTDPNKSAAAKKVRASHTVDFTEHGVFGIDHNLNIYIAAWWRKQADTHVTIDAGLDLAAVHKPALWFGEAGVIENAIGPSLRQRMRKRKIFVARQLLPSIHDKIARASGFMGRVSAGTVYLPKGEQWAEDLIDQLCNFPAGRFDDGVDVCGLMGRGLDFIAGGKGPKPAVQKKSWRDRLRAKLQQKERSAMTA